MKKSPKSLTSPSVQPPDAPDEDYLTELSPSGLRDSEIYANLVLKRSDLSQQSSSGTGLDRAVLEQVSLAATQLTLIKLKNVKFDGCDLANANWYRPAIEKVSYSGCRMTGIKLIEAVINNMLIINCKLDLSQFRAAKFKNVIFDNCDLREADFSGTNLQAVKFANCDLHGSYWYDAKLDGTDFRSSTLSNLQLYPRDLAGAIIDGSQLIDLAPELARLLGIKIITTGDM